MLGMQPAQQPGDGLPDAFDALLMAPGVNISAAAVTPACARAQCASVAAQQLPQTAAAVSGGVDMVLEGQPAQTPLAQGVATRPTAAAPTFSDFLRARAPAALQPQLPGPPKPLTGAEPSPIPPPPAGPVTLPPGLPLPTAAVAGGAPPPATPTAPPTAPPPASPPAPPTAAAVAAAPLVGCGAASLVADVPTRAVLAYQRGLEAFLAPLRTPEAMALLRSLEAAMPHLAPPPAPPPTPPPEQPGTFISASGWLEPSPMQLPPAEPPVLPPPQPPAHLPPLQPPPAMPPAPSTMQLPHAEPPESPPLAPPPADEPPAPPPASTPAPAEAPHLPQLPPHAEAPHTPVMPPAALRFRGGGGRARAGMVFDPAREQWVDEPPPEPVPPEPPPISPTPPSPLPATPAGRPAAAPPMLPTRSPPSRRVPTVPPPVAVRPEPASPPPNRTELPWPPEEPPCTHQLRWQQCVVDGELIVDGHFIVRSFYMKIAPIGVDSWEVGDVLAVLPISLCWRWLRDAALALRAGQPPPPLPQGPRGRCAYEELGTPPASPIAQPRVPAPRPVSLKEEIETLAARLSMPLPPALVPPPPPLPSSPMRRVPIIDVHRTIPDGRNPQVMGLAAVALRELGVLLTPPPVPPPPDPTAVANLRRRFPAASACGIRAALAEHGGHAGLAAAELRVLRPPPPPVPPPPPPVQLLPAGAPTLSPPPLLPSGTPTLTTSAEERARLFAKHGNLRAVGRPRTPPQLAPPPPAQPPVAMRPCRRPWSCCVGLRGRSRGRLRGLQCLLRRRCRQRRARVQLAAWLARESEGVPLQQVREREETRRRGEGRLRRFGGRCRRARLCAVKGACAASDMWRQATAARGRSSKMRHWGASRLPPLP